MIPLTDYSQMKNVHTSTVYRWIDSGKILKVNDNIFDPEIERLSDKAIKVIIADKKKEFEMMIKNANKESDRNANIVSLTVSQILMDIEHFAKKGIKIIGYSKRSCYRKINDLQALKRKVRKDAGEIENENLKICYDEFIKRASEIYFQTASGSVNLTIDKLIWEAKQDEDLYRIASVPKPTLYRAFKREVDNGLKEVHLYKKHYNVFDQTKINVTGAFDDMKFMDYLIGDDHKFDIHKILEYSPLRNKFEDKTLFSYFWIEAKTQKVLSYIVKTSALIADDVITTLLLALRQVGKPGKGLLIDNGSINQSDEFRTFCNKLDLNIDYSAPYQPTQKSTGERIFGYVKEEHDIFFNNFTGSNHKYEGVHTSLSMTPDKADYTVEDFQKSLDKYIEGFYQERPRTRVIKGKREKISIKEYFDNNYMTYEQIPVSDGDLKFAYMKEFATVKEFWNQILFKGEYYNATEEFGTSYNGRKYRIAYNPNDLSSIDLYSTVRFTDRSTGAVINPGDKVMTLFRTRTLTNKQAIVTKQNKEHLKAVKELANTLIDKVVIDNPDMLDTVNSTVGIQGELRNTRKAITKEVTNVLGSAVSEKQIKQIIELQTSGNASKVSIDIEDDPLYSEVESTQKDNDDDPLFSTVAI